jgi:hypothetical protein
MQQSKSNNEQILINKYLPHNFLAEKMILSCLLINSEAIEITYELFQLKLFILKIIKKFIKLLFLCIKIKYQLIFYINYIFTR